MVFSWMTIEYMAGPRNYQGHFVAIRMGRDLLETWETRENMKDSGRV